MASKINGLTELEEKFIDAFTTNGGNATQAYIDAGYSHKNKQDACANGNKLKRKYSINREINKRVKKTKKLKGDKIADLAELQELYTKIIRNQETETVLGFFDGEWQEIEKKASIKDKISAAEKLANLLKASGGDKEDKLQKVIEAIQNNVNSAEDLE